MAWGYPPPRSFYFTGLSDSDGFIFSLVEVIKAITEDRVFWMTFTALYPRDSQAGSGPGSWAACLYLRIPGSASWAPSSLPSSLLPPLPTSLGKEGECISYLLLL